MTKAAEQDTTEISRPLRVLVPLIKQELTAGNDAGLDHYQRAGEMLLEAKEQVERGGWGAWLKRNFHLSRSMADQYMRLATLRGTHARARNVDHIKTLRDVYPSQRGVDHQPTWHKSVRETAARVDVERMAQHEQARERERRLMRELAHQLIDIGFKVLATKLHPDKGGSAEGMARLNRVRTLLRQAI